jgi:hypothetical protein
LIIAKEPIMTKNNLTITGLKSAVESRDSAALQAYYADNAVLTIIDSINTPSKPRVIKGKRDIAAFLDDVCGRDMIHAIDTGIVDGKTLAYVERCQYADGTRVVASNTAELGPSGIVRQTTVQAWDS